jgi:predicted transcriptional regulator
LFGGSLTPLVTHFSNSRRRLKPAEVAALKKLLKDYKDD